MISVSDDDFSNWVRTVSGEARGEILEGQTAVAWVILVRASWVPPEWWGHSISQVCLKPYQFSCWLPGPDLTHIQNLKTSDKEYQDILEICQKIIDGETPDPTISIGHATHYCVTGTPVSWKKPGLPCMVIGRQSFYRVGPH